MIINGFQCVESTHLLRYICIARSTKSAVSLRLYLAGSQLSVLPHSTTSSILISGSTVYLKLCQFSMSSSTILY